MIDAFLKLLEDDATNEVDIKTLFKDKEEQVSWEKMVGIFDAIQIDNVLDVLDIHNFRFLNIVLQQNQIIMK